MFAWLRERKQESLASEPLPDAFRPWVMRAVHLYERLGDEDRRRLEGLVNAFLGLVVFEGAGGLTMTDEIRVTIAAQASLLALRRTGPLYPDLETVLVYPAAYVTEARHREGPVVIEGREARLGESWQRGLVVLAWDEIARDVRAHGTGHNVVLHEFAHQLDAEDGTVDGAPALAGPSKYRAWARVFGEAYADLGERLQAGLPSGIDAYATTSPPEFFAVVTEVFYERPASLRERYPELYRELASFYGIDPAALLGQ